MDSELLGAFALTAIMAAPLISLAVYVERTDVREQAIERGYALYCPDNGEWAWKGECETMSEEDG